jgi:hypothetical protein
VQIESVLASVALVGHLLEVPVEVVREARAYSLRFPGWQQAVTAWTVFGAAGLLILVILCWRHRRHLSSTPGGWGRLVVWITAFMLAGITVSKVFSPQFLIWLFPLVPLLPVGRAEWVKVEILFGGTVLLTSLVFPLAYRPLIRLHPGAILLLLSRNALFVVLVGFLIRRCLSVSQAPNGPESRPAAE